MNGNGYGASFSEYSENKVLMLMLKDSLTNMEAEGTLPMKVNVALPGVFQTNINFQWITDIMASVGLTIPHPRKIRKVDWRTGQPSPQGKFFAPYAATELQAYADLAMQEWMAGGTTSFAEYGALQIAAMMRKNAGLQGSARQDVLIDAGFMAAPGIPREHSLFQDFKREDQNVMYADMKVNLYATQTVSSRLRASRTWLLYANKADSIDSTSDGQQ